MFDINYAYHLSIWRVVYSNFYYYWFYSSSYFILLLFLLLSCLITAFMRKFEEDCLMEDPNHFLVPAMKRKNETYFRWNTEYAAEDGGGVGKANENQGIKGEED